MRQKGVAANVMKYFDDELAEHAFIAGENLTMCDITLFKGLGFADFAKVDIPSQYSHMAAWRERVSSRPGVKAVMG